MGWNVRSVERALLHRAARRYAAHGWDVMPGAAFDGDRHRCADLGCPKSGCHPALLNWADAATRDLTRVAAWWRDHPYTVLLPTGRAFDVVEVPAHLGTMVARGTLRGPGHRRRWHGPVAVSGTGRWMLLVRPGEALRPELDHQTGVLLHQRDSWVPAPPTREIVGRVRWEVPPDEVGWRLPDPNAVQRLLVDALLAVAPVRPARPATRTLVAQHR